MSSCLCCYRPLLPGQVDYHPACAKRLFGSVEVPFLDYRHDEVKQLAKVVVRSQTTVTGVQAKLSLDIEHVEHSSRFTIVGLWGRYILKPQTEQYLYLPEIEDLTMHLAELAGLRTVPHGLVRLADGELGYITRRIDRDNKGKKLPMEDLCQLSGQLTEHKYRGSYEQVARVIRHYSSAPMLDMTEFWRLILFCWITGNSDMHLKNFSLYEPDANRCVLTPAYDLVNTLLVMPKDPEELALNLNGKKRKLKAKDFYTAMTGSGLTEVMQRNIVSSLHRAQKNWESFVRMSFLPVDYQDSYLEMIRMRLACL